MHIGKQLLNFPDSGQAQVGGREMVCKKMIAHSVNFAAIFLLVNVTVAERISSPDPHTAGVAY